ncbi:MAG: bifunctional riboflavin kinase/FAD synthetase [Clostridia bacterium]|nr:bifunctional riboflavin kinase/FAD synthetase [Clostridia bacterium]
MGTAIALGNFDGVHNAHRQLIEKMLAFARKRKTESIVYVFEPHPRFLLCPSAPPALLMETDLKVRRLIEIGADRVVLEKRGLDVLSLTPREFVEKILVEELGAVYVTAGFNYRFGKNAKGDAETLKTLCKEYGITCEIMESVCEAGAPVSSTRLRTLLAEGDVKTVNALSFAPYTLLGTVQEGKKLGRSIGFPTLNVPLSENLLLPKKGVYISETRILNKVYKSVTNIGQNPTVEKALPRAESYLLGFDAEVYGEKAEITLLDFLRPETKFDSVEALRRQIEKDTEETRLYFERKDM